MLRYRLQELLAERQFRDGQRTTMSELSDATGVNRSTLSKMINKRGYCMVTENLDRLCHYFGCKVGDLVEYIPDDSAPSNK